MATASAEIAEMAGAEQAYRRLEELIFIMTFWVLSGVLWFGALVASLLDVSLIAWGLIAVSVAYGAAGWALARDGLCRRALTTLPFVSGPFYDELRTDTEADA